MQVKRFLFILLVLISSTTVHGSYLENENAVIVTAPIVDCLGKPARDIDSSVSIDEFYANLAYSPQTGPYSCPRVHQCLFNEVGVICAERGEELLIEFPHFYYHHEVKGTRESRFWLKKSGVMSLKALHKTVVDAIPEPINYKLPPVKKQQILTLILPWCDDKTGRCYSVGTRFLRNPQADTDDSWAFYLIDYENNHAGTEFVKKERALVSTPESLPEAKQLMVKIVRRWLASAEGCVPYVWGGCSYSERVSLQPYSLCQSKQGDADIANWQRPGKPGVRSGFDCSGLIFRAAQIVGLHYYCKNTTTIGMSFEDIKPDDVIEEGDLILLKGHVMLVSDTRGHKTIDASLYSTGIGCLQERPLYKVFVDVQNYDDLRRRADANHEPASGSWCRLLKLSAEL